VVNPNGCLTYFVVDEYFFEERGPQACHQPLKKWLVVSRAVIDRNEKREAHAQ
jgi:hypothetical protein